MVHELYQAHQGCSSQPRWTGCVSILVLCFSCVEWTSIDFPVSGLPVGVHFPHRPLKSPLVRGLVDISPEPPDTIERVEGFESSLPLGDVWSIRLYFLPVGLVTPSTLSHVEPPS